MQSTAPVPFRCQCQSQRAAVEDALGKGATLAEHQPQDDVRVMLDPAGHPFCLCMD